MRTPNGFHWPQVLGHPLPWLFGMFHRRGVLTAAAEPRSLGCGRVVVASPVHALDALVPVDDLEDLADEGAGLLGSILARRGG